MLGADKQGRGHVNTLLTIDQWFGVGGNRSGQTLSKQELRQGDMTKQDAVVA
jgi:hypothetical protein